VFKNLVLIDENPLKVKWTNNMKDQKRKKLYCFFGLSPYLKHILFLPDSAMCVWTTPSPCLLPGDMSETDAAPSGCGHGDVVW